MTPSGPEWTGWPVPTAVLLVALVTLAPLTRSWSVPAVGVAVLLSLLAGASARSGRGRTLLALSVVGWVAALVARGHGSVDVVVVSGVGLRTWLGLPELALLGRAGLREVLPELVGGGCACALVLYAARRAEGQDPSALLLALAAGGLLVVLGSRRVRR
jgi:hypothetical protein